MDEFVRRTKRPKLELESNSDVPSEVKTSHEPIRVVETPRIDAEKELPLDEMMKKQKRKFSFKVPTPKTKKQWILASILMALMLSLAGFAVYWFIIRDNSPAPVVSTQTEPEPEPAPEPIMSRLSGRELTSGAINERPIYSVQIENSPEARPQSGLKEADIIFEAVAEGGITRFNAIFQDNIPVSIGPVRSLRPYYIDWFMPFDAAIVHAGGSGEALSDVRTLGLKDIDSVSSIMRRVSGRYSPHNYYSTGQQVLDLMTQRGYKSEFTGFNRKVATPTATPNAKTINLRISSALYNVNFIYDSATNSYKRSQGGSPHVDAESGSQLAADVVVVPVMGKRIHPDRVHTQYDTVGSGIVYVFQDGTATQGTWTKSARNNQWQLADTAGAEIKLNPGQTWFTVVDNTNAVGYQP